MICTNGIYLFIFYYFRLNILNIVFCIVAEKFHQGSVKKSYCIVLYCILMSILPSTFFWQTIPERSSPWFKSFHPISLTNHEYRHLVAQENYASETSTIVI